MLKSNRFLLRFRSCSTTAQFNLGKLLLRRRRTEPSRAGSAVNRRAETSTYDDVLEAKGLLQKVIRENEEHSGARLCLAQALAEEGGAETLHAVHRYFVRGAAALVFFSTTNYLSQASTESLGIFGIFGKLNRPCRIVTTRKYTGGWLRAHRHNKLSITDNTRWQNHWHRFTVEISQGFLRW